MGKLVAVIAYCLLLSLITHRPSRHIYIVSPLINHPGHIVSKLSVKKHFFTGLWMYKS